MFLNLRKTPRIPTVVDTGMPPEMLNQEAYQVSEKSKMRIVISMSAAKYFEMIGCPITTANMHWSVLKNFDEQFNATK